MCVMCAKIISNIVIFAICNCNLKTKFTRCVYGKRFTLKLKIIFKKKNKLKFMKLKKGKIFVLFAKNCHSIQDRQLH